jgi:hypothetical protein
MTNAIHSRAYATDTMGLVLRMERRRVGTTALLGVELITNDPIIEASSFVQTVW